MEYTANSDHARPFWSDLQSAAPVSTWIILVAVAFAGSAVYGASVAYALGHRALEGGALWMILAAGLSWCAFGPLLMRITGRRALPCAFACLVTMAYGIGVLTAGAAVNMMSAHIPSFAPAAFNVLLVGVSNIVMACVLVNRFRELGVVWWKPLAAWIFGLDGVGAVLFWLFRGLLEGGRQ